MTDRPNLTAQIDALDNVVLSRQAWIRQAQIAVGKGQTRYDLQTTLMWQPALESALDSLRWLQAHEEAVRAFIAERRAA